MTQEEKNVYIANIVRNKLKDLGATFTRSRYGDTTFAHLEGLGTVSFLSRFTRPEDRGYTLTHVYAVPIRGKAFPVKVEDVATIDLALARARH